MDVNQVLGLLHQLQGQVHAQQNIIDQQNAQLQGAHQLLQALPGVQIQPQINMPVTGPKIPKPNRYKGERGKPAKIFMQNLETYFTLRPQDFPNPQMRIQYTILLLEDKAAAWGSTVSEKLENPGLNPPVWTTTWNGFKTHFFNTFGDPDEEQTAAYEITRLIQTRDAANYAVEFRQLVATLGWTEEGQLRQRYYKGLKDHVKDGLMYHRWREMDVDDLITLTINIDNEVFRRNKESKQTTGNTQNRSTGTRQPNPNPITPVNPTNPFRPPLIQRFNPPPGPPPTFPRTTQQGQPGTPRTNNPFVPQTPQGSNTSINANVRRVSPDERNYRQQYGLCYRCGGSGHQSRNCPVAYARATEVPTFEAWLAATQSSSATTTTSNGNEQATSESGNGTRS